ncbi:MAG: hypothetical protein QGI33_04385, partial [Candidatus Brocadiia bacterium]|nr:hypothetical protein [Candidatus Brocadiia bacterium]
PEDWTATETKADSMMSQGMRMTHLTRRYTRTADKMQMKVALSHTPQRARFMQHMVDAYKNPQALAAMNADPNMKVRLEEKDGWSVLTKVQGGKAPSVALMAVGNALMLQIGADAADGELASRFLGMFDLKGLVAAVGSSGHSNGKTEAFGGSEHPGSPPIGKMGKDAP